MIKSLLQRHDFILQWKRSTAVNSLMQQHVGMKELHQLPPLKRIILELYYTLDNTLDLQLQQHDLWNF